MFITRKRLASEIDRRIRALWREYNASAPITYERIPEHRLTDQDRADVAEALHDLATGNYSGPFATDEEIEENFAGLES